MALEVKANIVDTVFTTIPIGTKVADIVITGSDDPAITVYSPLYSVSKTAVTTVVEITNTNLTAIHFDISDRHLGETVTINNIYPKVTAKDLNKFSKPNMIYKVTKDISLNHSTLTIPAGCTLDFLGGIISNGNVILNNTFLKGVILLSTIIDATVTGTYRKGLILWFDDLKKIKIYNGEKWIDFGSGVNFRWSSSNTIQVSYDEGLTWKDLSPEFTNKLYIQGYVASENLLPANAETGSIYMVGPLANNKYDMYVRSNSSWVNNGSFTSITAGIVNELGDSAEVVTSLLGVSNAFIQGYEKLSGNHFIYDGKLDPTNGTVTPTGVGCKVTEFTPLNTANKVIVYGYSSDLTALVCFYDESRNFISSVSGDSNHYKLAIVSVPSGAVTCRATSQPDKGFLLTRGATDIYNIVLNKANTNVTVEYPLTGSYYTLSTAREAIPIEMRRAGHIITFSIKEGVWEQWLFLGIGNRSVRPTEWYSDSRWIKVITSTEYDLMSYTVDYLTLLLSGEYYNASNYKITEPGTISTLDGLFYTDSLTLGATLDYIPCFGSSYIRVTMPVFTSDGNFGIAFYDKNKKFVSGINRPKGSELGTTIIEIPTNGASYLRTSYWNLSNRVKYGDFSCKIFLDKNDKVVLDSREICEFFNVVASTGEIQESLETGLTSYIDCSGVLEIELTIPCYPTESNWGTVFYDKDKKIISGVVRPTNPNLPVHSETKVLKVPVGSVYFRTSYFNFANRAIHGEFKCTLVYPKGVLGHGKYRPYLKGLIHYSIKVNLSVSNFWDSSNNMQDSEDYLSSTGVLLLPTTYTPTGKPTKLIMYCHGMSNPVTYAQWGNPDSLFFLALKQRWADMGYAVFDCLGPRDDNKQPVYANGCPQGVASYRAAFDYIKQYYNVDPDIYIVGGSMGGDTALNYCFTFSNVRALAMISGWTDLFNCAWGQSVREPFVRYYGFSNQTNYEVSKIQGYDPSLRIVNIDNTPYLFGMKYPFKYWVGSLEAESALYKQAFNIFIPALKNALNNAVSRIVPNVGHEIVAGASEIADKEIGIWFSKY